MTMLKAGWRVATIGLAALMIGEPLAAARPGPSKAMSAEAFGAAVEVRHDMAARTTTFSTEPAHRPSRVSPIRHLLSDHHLRAVLDWRTGAIRYEVHQRILYWGAHARDRRDYGVALHAAPDGLRVGPVLAATHGESFCPNEDNWGHCALTRNIVFVLGEDEIRAIAARGRAEPAAPWTFRIAEPRGREWEGGIASAEAAGLLLAVERRPIPAG